MATNAQNVDVGVTGEVHYADAGATLPTSSSGALTGFTGLGYNGEDGITETQDESRTPIRAWQNGDTVREIRDAHSLTYDAAFIETTAASLEMFYGSGSYAAGAVEVTGSATTRGVWVVDVIDGAKKCRVCIPDGEITNRNAVNYANGSPVAYAVTITCYPDANGVKAYKYYAALEV